jgi:protein-disulfide isomerase
MGPVRARGTAGGVLAAVCVAAVLGACGEGATGTSTASGSAAGSVAGSGGGGTGAEVASLLAGIPQRANTLGDAKAPVTLEYFGDLECPYCRRFSLGTLPLLIRRYVRSGRLKIEYRSMESATHDPETFRIQQVAALAAGKQNKMWNYVELFYREQGEEGSGYVNEAFLRGLAGQVPGLDLGAWTAARSDPVLTNVLVGDAHVVSSSGFTRTPSFLVGTESDQADSLAIERIVREGSSGAGSPAGSAPH